MGLVHRRIGYDRKRLIAEADKARARGRLRRAISCYRRVLAAEPHEPTLHARIAPLLAAVGARFDAWQSYRQAASAQLRNRNRDEALALYREATQTLPSQFEAWEWVAKLERSRGRSEVAIEALLEGRSKFRSRRRRPEAIALLREARSIDAWRLDVVLDLARLLSKTQQAAEAQWILGRLANRTTGRDLRVVRAAQWRIEPSVKYGWLWLRAALSNEGKATHRVAARGSF